MARSQRFLQGRCQRFVAWLYGASAVNCSLLGIGERTGNVPLEAMVFEYASLRGSLDGMDPTAITDIAAYFRDEMGYQIPPMTPFVGENFNVTKAGIHADGLMKDEEIYNIFNTKKLLNRSPGVSISKTSGASRHSLLDKRTLRPPQRRKVHQGRQAGKRSESLGGRNVRRRPYHQPFHSGDRRQDQRAAQRR